MRIFRWERESKTFPRPPLWPRLHPPRLPSSRTKKPSLYGRGFTASCRGLGQDGALELGQEHESACWYILDHIHRQHLFHPGLWPANFVGQRAGLAQRQHVGGIAAAAVLPFWLARRPTRDRGHSRWRSCEPVYSVPQQQLWRRQQQQHRHRARASSSSSTCFCCEAVP